METGRLPSARSGLKAAVIDNNIFVTGGYDGENYLTEILHWDPSTGSWQHIGDLAQARQLHMNTI